MASERRWVSVTRDQYEAIEKAGVDMLRRQDLDAWKLLSVTLAWRWATVGIRSRTIDAEGGSPQGLLPSGVSAVAEAGEQPSAPIQLHEWSKKAPCT